MARTLRPSKAPNLPIGPVQYDQRYQDQFSNALRLYFTQLDNYTSALMANYGGRFINYPYLSAHDTSSQYDGSTTIPYAVRFNTTDLSNGVSITNRSFVGIGSITTTTMTITAVTSGRLFPSMILSGASVTSGTYVYLQLSSTATPITGTQTFVSGGAPAAFTFVVSGGNNLIEPRQFVSGTGVPANTRVTAVSYDPGTGNTTVTLSAAFTVQAAGNYVFRPWGYQGTYSVSPSQTAASETIYGTLSSLITFDYAGVYNIQFSLQFSNTDNNIIHEVDVWFKKNDIDIPNSNSRFSVPGKHSGLNGQLIAALNFVTDIQVGDVVEIVWHTTDSTVFIETIPAATVPVRPETPSAIVTVQFVSELPE